MSHRRCCLNNQFNTVFTYPITNEKQSNIAKRGIDEFNRLIPYVLAFIPKIGQVTIVNGSEVTTLKRQPHLLHNFIVQIDKTENYISSTIQIALCKNDLSAVAIELEPSDNSVKEIKEIPRIFCDFPLIGTEKFYFPVILNSFYFHPQTERDGIWLRGNDDKEVQLNQSIIQQAISLYETLLNSLTKVGVKKLFYAATTKMPDVNEKYFDKEWYKQKIQSSLREKIIGLEIVDTFKDGRVSFKEKTENGTNRNVLFPFGENSILLDSIWEITHLLKNTALRIPEKSDVFEWAKIIWSDENKLTIEKLASIFDYNIKSLESLQSYLGSETEARKWLNNFYKLLIDSNNTEFLSKYTLILNQNGGFNKLESEGDFWDDNKKPEIYKDQINDETLLNILKLLGIDWKSKLADNEIKIPLTASLSKQNIAHAITKEFAEQKGDWDTNSKNSILLLMEWLEKNGELGKELFPEIYRKRAELFMNTISDKESLYRLMKSTTPLLTLSEIAIAIENDPEILNIIEKRKQELEEEKERNKIGEAVEVLLAEVLENYGFTVEKTHIGRDLIIACKGRINYDIEVKSTSSGGFVSLTPTQANAAVQKSKHYSLCVVHKNGQELTKEYVAENAKFVNNIGELIVSKVQDVQRFNNAQNTLTIENGGIGILIENPLSFKYKVNSNIWTSGTNILNFVEKIKTLNNQIIQKN